MDKSKRIRERPVDELSLKKRMGLNLRALRESAEKSQDEFARLFGVPLPTYKKWENGTSYPQADGITLLAEMGYDVNFLYLGYGPKRRPERIKNKKAAKPKAAATG